MNEELKQAVDRIGAGIKGIGERLDDVEATQKARDMDVTERQNMKDALAGEYGKDGGEMATREIVEWFSAAILHKVNGGQLPQWLHGRKAEMETARSEIIEGNKVFTADATTGSYLTPTLVFNEVRKLRSIYGPLYRECRKVTVPEGVLTNLPNIATGATAGWQVQGGTIPAAGETFGKLDVQTKLLGGLNTVSNELLGQLATQGGYDFAKVFVEEMIRASVQAIEEGLIYGDNTGGTAPPSDGFTVETSVWDQTNIADDTHEKLTLFITESLVDVESLYNKAESVILMHPTKWRAVRADSVADSTVGDTLHILSSQRGEEYFEGYKIIQTPACYDTSAYWAVMFHPPQCWIAESSFAVFDANPYDASFALNATTLRLMSHVDWAFPVLSTSIADYT